jgi:murein DD-endopeptidase MepM/ murein hydrolase activator NlpD
VYASASGKVEYAGWNDYGYGNLIVIDHGDGWRTLYAHNSAFKVSTGDTVEQGNVIASSGNTGNSTMPHIHLEMIRSKQPQNPCLFLLGGC